MDPYEILGIDRDSDENTIKKAYKKMAMKWHPDKNPEGEETFKKINWAYEQLTKPGKDDTIDILNEIFSSFFGIPSDGPLDEFGDFLPPKPNLNVIQILDVSLEDLYCGTVKSLTHDVNIIDSDMENIDCKLCEGSGKILMIEKLNASLMNYRKIKCKKCSGGGKTGSLKIHTKSVEVNILPGSDRKIIISGGGNQSLDGTTGDLVIHLEILNHSIFILDNNDLKININLTLKEFMLGTDKTITHLDKKQFVFKIKQQTKFPTKTKKLTGKGMPYGGLPTQLLYGNMYVSFNIIFPDSLNEKQILCLNKHF